MCWISPFSRFVLVVLHGFGGCAMLALCTKPGIGGAARYQEILTFPKPKIVDTNEIPGRPFFS
jgi:hypothetical protein